MRNVMTKPRRKSGLRAGTIRLRKDCWERVEQLAADDRRKVGDWLRIQVEQIIAARAAATANAA